MNRTLEDLTSALGRVLLCAIFVMAAAGNDIPNFDSVAGMMASKGMPAARFLLAGAIVFLLAGGVSVILGYRARLGAALLFAFLVPATLIFHNFWAISDPKAKQDQMIHFMKNLSMMGAMLFIIASGPGRFSLDERRSRAATGGGPG